MRRCWVVLVGLVLLGSAVAAPDATAAAPSVAQVVHVNHRPVDLTDGGVTEIFRIQASSTAKLALIGAILSGPVSDSSTGDLYLRSQPNNVNATDPDPLTKLSGNATSGVWRVRLPLTRFIPAGSYDVSVEWLAGRTKVWREWRRITVVNPHGDMRPPVLVSLNRPAEGAHFSQTATPVVSAHLVDSGSGVGLVYFCYLSDSDPQGAEPCDEAKRISGTARDGVWTAHLTNLDMLPPGPAALRLQLNDRVTRYSTWDPADEAEAIDGGFASVIPDGRGDFTITK